MSFMKFVNNPFKKNPVFSLYININTWYCSSIFQLHRFHKIFQEEPKIKLLKQKFTKNKKGLKQCEGEIGHEGQNQDDF